MDAAKIKRTRTLRIHPAIGIARIGNSNEYFYGPEVPGVYQFPKGGYRDGENRLKKEAARFRLFAYDEADRSLGEIDESDAIIEWHVHLRNTKAVGRMFGGVLNPDLPQRNQEWLANNSPQALILDPGKNSVAKARPERSLVCKEFMGVGFEPELELGRLIYEEGSGRLCVLGGSGRAGTPFPSKYKLIDEGDFGFANHDGWFDDVCDGPVTAEVRFQDTDVRAFVKPAWVVVAPPKFAPEFQTIVTLYDTLSQVAIDQRMMDSPFSDPTFRPSFNRDIYPILRRADLMRWVFAKSDIGHTFAVHSDDSNLRQHVFRQFRVPSGHPHQPGTGTGRMPYVWSDLYLNPAVNGTLTQTQYRIMQAWAEGEFEDDWSGGPPPLSFQIGPEGLDRAALEACVGAAFYPGIEVSWKMRDVFRYAEPFRLDHDSLVPGDVTQQMSLPWQTDYIDCAYEEPYVWWPAQRPINVKNKEDSSYSSWARPFDLKQNADNDMEAKEMVHDFFRLGHVLRSGDSYVEVGRADAPPMEVFNKRNFKNGH